MIASAYEPTSLPYAANRISVSSPAPATRSDATLPNAIARETRPRRSGEYTANDDLDAAERLKNAAQHAFELLSSTEDDVDCVEQNPGGLYSVGNDFGAMRTSIAQSR